MNDDKGEKSLTRRGLVTILITVLAGALLVAILKAVYPHIALGQVITLITVVSILTAITIQFILSRRKHNGDER